MVRCLSRSVISRLHLQRFVTRKIIAEHSDAGEFRRKKQSMSNGTAPGSALARISTLVSA